MPRIVSLRRCLLATTLLLLPACGQKLDYESTLQVDDAQVQSISVDPPKKEQKVNVVVTSSASPVDVYVVLEKDKEAGKQSLLNGNKPAESLTGKLKTQDTTLEATIPANTGFAILLGGASKSTQVKVKVTGR